MIARKRIIITVIRLITFFCISRCQTAALECHWVAKQCPTTQTPNSPSWKKQLGSSSVRLAWQIKRALERSWYVKITSTFVMSPIMWRATPPATMWDGDSPVLSGKRHLLPNKAENDTRWRSIKVEEQEVVASYLICISQQFPELRRRVFVSCIKTAKGLMEQPKAKKGKLRHGAVAAFFPWMRFYPMHICVAHLFRLDEVALIKTQFTKMRWSFKNFERGTVCFSLKKCATCSLRSVLVLNFMPFINRPRSLSIKK